MVVNVWWVSLHDGILDRGYADQDIVEGLLDGSLWRVPLPEFRHRTGLPDGGEGGVVVIPARWHAEDVETIRAALERMRWAIVILTGDEESVFAWRLLRLPHVRVWVQTPRPDRHGDADGLLGDGAWAGTREWVRNHDPDRRSDWFYSGQINNERREECFAALRARRDARNDGIARSTTGFAAGMPRPEYLAAVAEAKLIPAPAGCYSPDTFRLYEALEAGCVPVADYGVDGRAHPDYWRFVFHVEPPWPILRAWEEFSDVADRLLRDWPMAANRAGAWWIAEKRYLARRFQKQLRDLSGWEPPERPDEAITVLMPVSPIPSHPAADVLDETLRSVRERLPGSEIILMFDGVREEQGSRADAYAEHVRRIIRRAQTQDLPRVLPIVFEEHRHQAAMTAAALREVETPLILFVEQDTPLVGDVPFRELSEAVLTGAANVVRLHHEAAVLPPHQHLMIDVEPQEVAGVPLLRTVQWSQRPHLASSTFYREMIARYFGPGARSFIEDVIHGVVHNLWEARRHAGWDEFRLWLYAPPGDMKRSTHTDGRAGDPKFGQTWEYPNPETPAGAPNPRTVVPRVPRHGRNPAVKWGLIGRADRRGLATQTTEIARHLEPDRVLGVDMHDLSPYRPDWREYNPETLMVVPLPDLTPDVARRWLDGLDVVVSAETFYRPWWTSVCREKGVATLLAPNPEFFTHVAAEDWAPRPDVLGAPTRWRIGELAGAVHLPHPVDRERLPYRERTEARTFLHVIGHAAKWDRAGTRLLWEALQRVESSIRVVVRSQSGVSVPERYRNVEVEIVDRDLGDYWDLYTDGDVMILPRRYGGLCLPMQEALSVGMPVIMPDASPQNGMLTPGMLVPCRTERTVPSNVGALPVHDTEVTALAARIDQLASSPEEVRVLSKEADEIADSLSWETLAPVWCDTIERASRARLGG